MKIDERLSTFLKDTRD